MTLTTNSEQKCRTLHMVLTVAIALCAAGCSDDDRQPAPTASRPVQESPAEPPESSATDHDIPPAGPFSFETLGPESGFVFERYDDIRGQRRILEANGGGVGVFDFDADGLLDAFMTNGCRLPREADDRDTPSALFRNLGDMKFESVANQALLSQFGFATGCTAGDFDADGFDDLYVAAFGRNTMWRNNGDGTFTDVTEQTQTDVPLWSSSAAFADVNTDGHPDLYVVNYLDESDTDPTLCPDRGSPDGFVSCSPAQMDGVDDVLLLSDGRGGFIDVSAEAGIAGRPGKGLGVVVSDLDGDLQPEIYVANDGQANYLFVRTDVDPATSDPRTVRFEERAVSSALALNESGFAQASMGIAAGDCNGDGSPDLFLTHFYSDTNTLYTSAGGLYFDDVTRASGLGPSSRSMLGFGTAFVDADNDGALDLLVANGHVDDHGWRGNDEPYRMEPQIYRNDGTGSFQDVSWTSGTYFREKWLGRGLSLGDFDRDRKIDAIFSHQLAPSAVLRNTTPTNSAGIALRLVGTTSNRSGFGTRVEVLSRDNRLTRELAGGSSFQSSLTNEIHIGFGDAEAITIEIHWSSGAIDKYADVSSGRWLAIERRTILSTDGS